MEKVHWKVEGMSCSNCALTINKFLQDKGLQNVKVSFAGGDVSFDLNEALPSQEIQQGIKSLGYTVIPEGLQEGPTKRRYNKNLLYLLFCLPFTLVLMMHMLDKWIHWHWLMSTWIQLGLCLPVYLAGMKHFGPSAIKSIRNGIPNMNVLVAMGATAAFLYSLIGTLADLGPMYMYYETTAAIITFIFFGNYLESVSVRSTQRALNQLVKSQKVMANMIAFDDNHQEIVFPVENTKLHTGDLILIRSGEQVPADCKILWGGGTLDEAIITGESLPVQKNVKDLLLGGSTMTDGSVKAQVTANAAESVLAIIIHLVKEAQGEKPPVQQMADRISTIFVPLVLGVALLTFLANFGVLKAFTPSLMRCIAVLVIACPCAMGLATPAAIAVGLGRAAKKGILFRHASSLERFKDIRQVVFDKTGTLTTGDFVISAWEVTDPSITKETFQQIAYSIEKYSNHPLAKTITQTWKTQQALKWKTAEELKGLGVQVTNASGDSYAAGSFRMVSAPNPPSAHNVYILKNGSLLGWIDVRDQLRPEAAGVVNYFRSRGIKTILLSGDRRKSCEEIAATLHMDQVFAEQLPEQKLKIIADLNADLPTAMVGDGINDAPALARAAIGVSMSDASHIAMQTADVVLMGNGIANLPLALGLGRETYLTIKQNLFWAFFYNVIAIPVAAFGLLTPAWAALAMGLSDVLLVGNSIRLYMKKIK